MRAKRRNRTSLLSRAPIAGCLRPVRKHFGISQDPMARFLGCSREIYTVMGYYRKFKLENKHTILQALGHDQTAGNK